MWLLKSSDLTQLDFYLWGTAKMIVYYIRADLQQELINKINDVFAELKQDRYDIHRVLNSISQC